MIFIKITKDGNNTRIKFETKEEIDDYVKDYNKKQKEGTFTEEDKNTDVGFANFDLMEYFLNKIA